MAVVVLLFVCGWISIINAQPTATLLPQAHQTVCRGESISYNCAGTNGTNMEVFSPPIVSESSALLLFSSHNVPTCRVTPNSGAAIVLVDSPSFMGTFTLYISDEQSEGQRTVSCRVTAADGMFATNETTFSVLDAPSAATLRNFQVSASSSEDMSPVPVNVSWDSPENAQEFMLQVSNTSYSTTIRSLESSVTVYLPYGNYSATLCTINRCGKTCPDNSTNFSVEPRQQRSEESNNDSLNLVIALAVVTGVLGLLFILIFIYAIIVTVIICKTNKVNAPAVAADETKEMEMD